MLATVATGITFRLRIETFKFSMAKGGFEGSAGFGEVSKPIRSAVVCAVDGRWSS